MPKLIQGIEGSIPNTNHKVNIHLDGRNLIIVGGNGSGKTSFLREIFNRLSNNISSEAYTQVPNYRNNIASLKRGIEGGQLNEHDLVNFKKGLEDNKNWLSAATGILPLTYNDPLGFIKLKRQKLATVRLFEADRKANISHVTAATGSLVDINAVNADANLGTNLEQHLVNLRVRTALAALVANDSARTEEINQWFAGFTKNLRYLFEDDSTELLFDADRLKFSIVQSGRIPFTFQTLSSGYLAIFDIYADLLMRTEYFKTTPTSLAGVVLIDELDAHLHVSLQRKIFPFLTRSFPNVQFIITTHSPFVLTSVDNTLIYDITTNRESNDLTMYSFESVVEGLLGVPPVSKELEDTIKYLATATAAEEFDIEKVQATLQRISPHVDTLDSESAMFYQIAVNKLIKAKSKKS